MDSHILENNQSIEEKGKLDEQTLRMIYNRLFRSNAYSRVILRDIHDSFNKAGITGLKNRSSILSNANESAMLTIPSSSWKGNWASLV